MFGDHPSESRVVLWDTVADRSLGQLLDAGISSITTLPLVDPANRTAWFGKEGEIVQVPVDPTQWIERACEVVGRDLTQAEWDRHVPGGGDVIAACDE